MISDTAIKRLIGDPDYSRGAAYFRQGKVLNVEVESDEFVAGEVSGSGRRIYEQDIHLDWNSRGGLIGITGHCSCPVGYNCKHMAAVMLAAAPRLGSTSLAPIQIGRKPAFVPDEPTGPSLPGDVDVWLGRVAEVDSAPPLLPPSAETLLYMFRADSTHSPQIMPYKARLLKGVTTGARGRAIRFAAGDRREGPAFYWSHKKN